MQGTLFTAGVFSKPPGPLYLYSYAEDKDKEEVNVGERIYLDGLTLFMHIVCIYREGKSKTSLKKKKKKKGCVTRQNLLEFILSGGWKIYDLGIVKYHILSYRLLPLVEIYKYWISVWRERGEGGG